MHLQNRWADQYWVVCSVHYIWFVKWVAFRQTGCIDTPSSKPHDDTGSNLVNSWNIRSWHFSKLTNHNSAENVVLAHLINQSFQLEWICLPSHDWMKLIFMTPVTIHTNYHITTSMSLHNYDLILLVWNSGYVLWKVQPWMKCMQEWRSDIYERICLWCC